jgi:hypothetical protein
MGKKRAEGRAKKMNIELRLSLARFQAFQFFLSISSARRFNASTVLTVLTPTHGA